MCLGMPHPKFQSRSINIDKYFQFSAREREGERKGGRKEGRKGVSGGHKGQGQRLK